ncbi:MAG: tetratricopeptide repeat protein [Candidatus Saccharimonadales bacterium]
MREEDNIKEDNQGAGDEHRNVNYVNTSQSVVSENAQVTDSPTKKGFFSKIGDRMSRKRSTDSISDLRPSKFKRFLKRYWYVAIAMVIVIGVVVAWFSYVSYVNSIWSKAADYHGRADYANAAKLIENMPIPTEKSRLQVYAQTMLATRKLDKALPAYDALYKSEKDPTVKIVIGNIYNEQKKYDDAEKTYRELITANDTFVQAFVNLSTLYKLQGKNTDAIDVAKKGVKANPNSVVLNELLISMLLEKKDSEDFKQAVEALRKINPKSPIFEAIKNN